MSVRLLHSGLPADLTPYRLKLLLRQAKGLLGLSKGAIRYLEFALENCQPEDFRQNRICAIWYSLEKLARILGLTSRQVTRIEAELVKAGLIVRTYPRRKGRFGNRADGIVTHAAGINLAPLIEQAERIREMALRQAQEDKERVNLRNHLTFLFDQIRNLACENADQAASVILPRRRPSEVNDIAQLQEIADALEAVLAEFSPNAGQSDMSVRSDENVRPYTKPKTNIKTRRQSRSENAERPTPSPKHARILASPRLGEYIDFYTNGRPPTWETILLAARDRAHELGISAHEWREQCLRLGDSSDCSLMIWVRRAALSVSPIFSNASQSFLPSVFSVMLKVAAKFAHCA